MYAIVGMAVPPLVFYFLNTEYSWIDVVAASLAAAVVQLLPTVGGTLALFVMGAPAVLAYQAGHA